MLIIISPPLPRRKFSLVKVLNVVNPPQKPTVSKVFTSWLILLLLNNPVKSPIRKHPRTFTAKVANGNDPIMLNFRYLEIKYLSAPPQPLPRKTNKTNFIINYELRVTNYELRVTSYECA